MHLGNVRLVFLSMIAAATTCSAAVVEQVCVRQMWPWHEKVRIDYTLAGEIGELSDIAVKVRDVTGNELKPLGSSFSGDLLEVLPGERVIWWNPAEAGIEIGNKQLTFTLEAVSDPQRYCVIDISVPDEYKVTYHEKAPDGGWNTDEYKTTKIVFRHVKPGTFMMGTPADEAGRRTGTEGNNVKDMDLHKVTLTKDYWLAIFPLTFKQATLINGSEFGKTSSFVANQKETSPAVSISMRELLGMNDYQTENPTPAEWYASPVPLDGSWFYKLNAGITEGALPQGTRLWLPTEAQWEYACRAGTTSAYGNGTDSIEGIGPIRPNSSPMKPVGGYNPNAWGFYDMHGCVWEWTIDSYGGYVTGSGEKTDPYYPMSPTSYWPALRGGCFADSSTPTRDNRSGSRHYRTYSVKSSFLGARIAIVKAP